MIRVELLVLQHLFWLSADNIQHWCCIYTSAVLQASITVTGKNINCKILLGRIVPETNPLVILIDYKRHPIFIDYKRHVYLDWDLLASPKNSDQFWKGRRYTWINICMHFVALGCFFLSFLPYCPTGFQRLYLRPSYPFPFLPFFFGPN